jgi:hypothetical protein
MSNDLVLYRFFDADGELLYIGKSVRAWERFATHRSTSEFYPAAVSVKLQRGFLSSAALSMAEVAAIKAESPRFNVAHSRSQKPEPCQGPHHCRKVIGGKGHSIDVCRERDEEDRVIADRVDSGELTDARSLKVRDDVRAELVAGVHGCWEHYRPLTDDDVRMARTLRASGEPVEAIAKTLGVGRATMYRALGSAE